MDAPPRDPIRVSVEHDGHRTVVRAAGEIDLLTVAEVQQPLDEALAQRRPVSLDLRAVEFIDSTGLRLLLETRGRAVRVTGEGLALVLGDTQPVRRLLELTGVMDLFDVS